MNRKFYYKLWFRLIVFVAITMIVALTVTSLSYLIFVNNDLRSPPDRTPGLFFVFFISFSVFLGTILAAIIGKTILKPIYDLNHATEEIAKGNFKIRLNTENKSEIGDLSENFNKMAKELQNNEMIHNDFINNVSHEFNTPLSSILGYSMILQDKRFSVEEKEEAIDKIIYSTKRLSKLTSNILNLSRLDNQEIISNKKQYALDEQIRRVILDLEESWAIKEIELNIDLEETFILGDQELISQIWYNIIHNAIKFSENNGKVDIFLKQYENYVVVTIKDYGKGMNENTVKHMFDKFYQFENSRTIEGNGLGLAIVKRIADLNNILIEVNSNINTGTEFTFKINNIKK